MLANDRNNWVLPRPVRGDGPHPNVSVSYPTRAQRRSGQNFCSLPHSRSAALRLGSAAASAAPPSASRQSPPSSAHRPATLGTHLPLPSRLCCTVGARPAAQGGRACDLAMLLSYGELFFVFSDLEPKN